jgi:hypothetical protein
MGALMMTSAYKIEMDGNQMTHVKRPVVRKTTRKRQVTWKSVAQ